MNSSIVFQITTAGETIPVVNATVDIYHSNGQLLHRVYTNESGKTESIPLQAPDIDGTRNAFLTELPYQTYNAYIYSPGYQTVFISGIQLYGGIESIQVYELQPLAKGESESFEEIQIPAPYIRTESEGLLLESVPSQMIEARILNTVYIPKNITVHLGRPDDSSARNVTVSFTDYIKNVASSEIYPTWPENSLRANIYAQISFVLNRVFTEWYTSRGYSFDITNHTGYDQYFVYGRNIFENISKLVDDIFNEYVRKQGALNPYFTEYCNGSTVTCKGMSQWGTVSLAENGYTPLEILRYYYGNEVEITATDNIQDIISSYPGYSLKEGMTDSAVITVKEQLNRVRKNYPLIPQITNLNNYFDTQTKEAVKQFQTIFNLTSDGIVGKATWNKLSYLYVAVLKLAELNGGMITMPIPEEIPTIILKQGVSNDYVKLAQYMLVVISMFRPAIPETKITGYFGELTKNAVMAFQSEYGLQSDGVIGPLTWEQLYNTFVGIGNAAGLIVEYPGSLLKVGSRGDMVWLMQGYLNKIAENYPIPALIVDGIFGSNTQKTVKAFQALVDLDQDGIIGQKTWDMIVAVRLLVGK